MSVTAGPRGSTDAEALAAPARVPVAFELRGTVATTIDPSRAVINRLSLAIARPPAKPDGLGPGVLPGSEAVFVTFRWGGEPEALCTPSEAAAIVVTPDADSADWTVTRSSTPDGGHYWILEPDGPPLAPGATRGFVFDSVVSSSAPDLPPTLCFASCTYRDPTGAEYAACASFWRVVPLAVAVLQASPPASTPRAPVTLTWSTTGARRCVLEPGEHDALPPAGALDVRTERGQTYTLGAVSAEGVTATRTIEVGMVRGWSELTRQPVVSGDRPVLLDTGAELVCLQPEAGALLTSRDGRDWRPRPLTMPVAPWGAGGVGVDGRLILAGGVPIQTAAAGDSFVLSSADGRDWTTITSSAWSIACRWPGLAFYGDRLWALGGLSQSGPVATVATSGDGTTWTTSAAPWAPRMRPGVACLGEEIWLGGGVTGAGPGAGVLTDIWRLGFAGTWQQGPAPPWAAERVITRLAVVAGHLHALTIPLGEAPVALWALRAGLAWELLDGAAPIRSHRLLGARIEATSFFDGLLAVSDAGAWWWGGD